MRTAHSADLVARQVPPVEYVVDGFLPAGGVADISGPPGDGKSTIVLSMSEAISTGRHWFGRPVQRMPVAYVTGEASSEEAFSRDLQRLKAAEDSDITVIFPDAEMFRFERQSWRWITTNEGAKVIQFIRDAHIRLVVLDTIGSVCAGMQEVDNDIQRQLARHVRREFSGLSTITVSHTNQASAKEKLEWRLHYLSRAGGNGFPGGIRWAAGVSRVQQEDAEALGINADQATTRRFVALGASKHNEIARPDWNNNTPAIFEILANGELVLVQKQLNNGWRKAA